MARIQITGSPGEISEGFLIGEKVTVTETTSASGATRRKAKAVRNGGAARYEVNLGPKR